MRKTYRTVVSQWIKNMPVTANCILWPFTRNSKGYGIRYFVDENGIRRGTGAHRWIYEKMVGPIPHGLTCDHICQRKRCVNPAHIRLISNRENILCGDNMAARYARRELCPKGHAFDIIRSDGARRCSTCRKAYNTAYYLRTKGRKITDPH